MILATLLLAGGVTVTLEREVEATGLEIELHEVATVTSADPEDPVDDVTLERVRAASLGYAPAPGYHRILRSDLVELSLRRKLQGVDIEVKGAKRCKVTPKTETVEAERIWEIAQGQIEALYRGADASLRRAAELEDVIVPVGNEPLEIRPAVANGEVEAGPKSVAIQFIIDGDVYRTVHAPYDVALREPRWVLVRPVPSGQVLNADMFQLRPIEVGFTSSRHALSPSELVGAVAAKPLRAGFTVGERDITRPLVVRKGEIVTVLIQSGSVEARDMGVAQQSGHVGELIAVKLNHSGRELTGRVRIAGEVVIKLR